MPDRFADGDPVQRSAPRLSRPAPTIAKSPMAYHGGDLKGIQEHLPYLKDLGVTTFWLTPLYQNDKGSSDYHGYGAVDEYAVEDHFGTMQDFQQLVAAAHQLGMKVLLDMVPNHVGPNHPWANSQPTPGWLHGTPEHHIDNSDYDFPPISDPHAVPANYIRALDGWFVNKLPDLAQENPLVAAYLLQNALVVDREQRQSTAFASTPSRTSRALSGPTTTTDCSSLSAFLYGRRGHATRIPQSLPIGPVARPGFDGIDTAADHSIRFSDVSGHRRRHCARRIGEEDCRGAAPGPFLSASRSCWSRSSTITTSAASSPRRMARARG